MGIEWDPVDDQLEEWAEKYPGKELLVVIIWEYAIDDNATNDVLPQTNNARIARTAGTARTARPNAVGGSSTTANMLRHMNDVIRGGGGE